MTIIMKLKKLNVKQYLTFLSILILPVLIIFSLIQQTAQAHSSTLTQKTTSSENTSSDQIIVSATALNVRETGDRSSHIINVVHKGDTFTVIQTQNNWDQISLPNNQTGWINKTYVTQATAPESLEAIVKAPVLNVRKSPGLTSTIVGKLTLGTNVTIHEELNGWANVVSSAGVQGWVDELYINKNTNINHISTTDKTSVSKQTANKISIAQSSTKTSRSFVLHSASQAIKAVLPQTNQGPLTGKTIVLDPGHGGKDDGTTSPITETHEKTLTLATAQDVAQKLKSAGANVIMTRTTDTYIPLQQRADLSNKNHADAFISFHYNESSDLTANGIIDFYYQKSRDDLLAGDILNEVVKSTGLQDDGTRFDNLDVLRNNTQPCTLIELGFLSNKHDDSIVEGSVYKDKVAQGVYQGLLDYFSM